MFCFGILFFKNFVSEYFAKTQYSLKTWYLHMTFDTMII